MLRALGRITLTLTAVAALLVGVLVWDGRLDLETRWIYAPRAGGGTDVAGSDDPSGAGSDVASAAALTLPTEEGAADARAPAGATGSAAIGGIAAPDADGRPGAGPTAAPAAPAADATLPVTPPLTPPVGPAGRASDGYASDGHGSDGRAGAAQAGAGQGAVTTGSGGTDAAGTDAEGAGRLALARPAAPGGPGAALAGPTRRDQAPPLDDQEPAGAGAVPEIGTPSAPAGALPAAGGAAAPVTLADAPAAPLAGAPVFDVLRVTPDGNAVVAGRAQPGQRVSLLVDGEAVGEAVADADGSFVIIAEVGAVEAPRALQLRAEAVDGGAASVTTTTLAPGGAAAVPARVALLDPAAGAPRPAAPPVRNPGDDTGTAAVLGQPVVLLPAEGEASPQVVEAGPDRVALADPGDAPVPGMVLDTVTYVPDGAAVARGRSPAGSRVRVFVNNRRVSETVVPDSGDWSARLPREWAERARVLRFEEVDAAGEVETRLETRFDYDPTGGALALADRSIVVERGDNLWTIAEAIYGAGVRYSVIFSANDDLIVDPDLIYPDQELTIPQLSPTAEAAEPAPRPRSQLPPSRPVR